MTFIEACIQAMGQDGGGLVEYNGNIHKVTESGEVYYVDGHNAQYGYEWRVIDSAPESTGLRNTDWERDG